MFLELKQEIEQHHNATLIAVSKTQPIEKIKSLYDNGQRHFGENKVQEMLDKKEQLPTDILWHAIGHLQSNKVKYIVPFIHLIHSVDSFNLLKTIEKEAAKVNRKISILLQIHIAEEETKFGLNKNELIDLLEHVTAQKEHFSHIEICGLMGMASFTNDKNKIEQEMQGLQNLFLFIKNSYFPLSESFKEISMGMSSDYKIALNCGSTLVRVGSLLFGKRD
jgi:pyridoxal phosphate enzyme (YggS family)